MARWRLTQKHYLNVPGTEWEYKETSESGKQARKVYAVPAYLDPDAPSDQNYPGEIIVAYAKGALRADIIFVGEPTPDMEPLDDEAQAISDELRPKWLHPIDTLGDEGFAGSIIDELQKIRSSINPSSAIPSSAFEALQKQVAELAAQNTLLAAQLAEGRRRV